MTNENELPNIDPTKTDRIIAKAIDDSKKEASDNLIRLSTGVILKAKQANPSVLIRVMTKQKRPQPPVVFMEAMGRMMENPNDPDYIDNVQAWKMDYSNGMLNVMIGLGTELVSKPDSVQGPNDKDWLKDYEMLGLPIIPDSSSWCYITWVMYVAAPTDKDLNLISGTVKTLSGTPEADVRDAENFPTGN